MADDRFSSPRTGDADSTDFPARGSRPGGGRDGGRDSGGFRIRLSDNEMQAARALQEAFGLRSTVAVLGFSLRTLAQQLEQGQLDALIAQHRAQAGSRPAGGGSREGGRGGDRRRERPGGDREGGRGGRGERIDPFARPSRPAPAAEESAAHEPEPGLETGDGSAADTEGSPASAPGSAPADEVAVPADTEVSPVPETASDTDTDTESTEA